MGKVVSVHDGDTISIYNGEGKVKVRLAEIDAPEKKQEYGNEAYRFLERNLLGVDVKVDVSSTDRYGRKIGKVYVDNVYMNSIMVENGYAWVYKGYCPKKSPLWKVEEVARSRRVGLWKQDNPVPPWQYRKMK